VPRRIIDTESSRPAYVRRKILTFVVVILLAITVASVAWFSLKNHNPAAAPSTQGNSAH
jgi:hypothetical protein